MEEEKKPKIEKPKKIFDHVAKQLQARPARIAEKDGHIKQVMVYMAMWGTPTREISEKLGISKNAVRTFIESESGRREIERLQGELLLQRPDEVFKAIAPQAVQVIYEIMKSKKERGNNRISAAFGILDRAFGKPTQVVDHKGSLISDLISQLDRIEKGVDVKSDTIDAQYETIEEKTKRWMSDGEKPVEENSDEDEAV